MAEYRLTAVPPLGGYRETFDGLSLEERPDVAIVSVAVPEGGRSTLEKAMTAAYGASLPAAGRVTRSRDGRIRFLGMSADQFFALFDDPTADAVPVVAANLGDCGYFTMQSDNWVKLRLSGPRARERLALLCPIDLDPSAFPRDGVARTVIEHLGAVILPEGDGAYLLLSASSSADSFLDAVRTCLGRASTGLGLTATGQGGSSMET